MQGAYGILCEVESHPFATDAMLFMDWRDDHTSSDPEMQESNRYRLENVHDSGSCNLAYTGFGY